MQKDSAQVERIRRRIRIARQAGPCDIVIRGAEWLDVSSGVFRSGDVGIFDGVIVGVGGRYQGLREIDGRGLWVVPGFIDAHVHIESSMITPREFARTVRARGTTTAIWDPHEIANVRGEDGLRWSLQQAEGAEIDIRLMIPSCVPSTSPSLGLETPGATMGADVVGRYVGQPQVLGLAEMMNVPGVLGGDDDVLSKLVSFDRAPRDGHAPLLGGSDLDAYLVAGVSTCHESTSLGEGAEKLSKGMHVWIREGSCAKDARTLLPLLTTRSAPFLGFCTDDRNPLDIADEGHIDFVANLALAMGQDPVDVFRAASTGPAMAYQLRDRGRLAPGYRADLCLIAPRALARGAKVGDLRAIDWKDGFEVVRVLCAADTDTQGIQRAQDSRGEVTLAGPNIRFADRPNVDLFELPSAEADGVEIEVNVIGVKPRQILTDWETGRMRTARGRWGVEAHSDLTRIAVLERHHRTGRRTVGWVRGMGLRRGAIATSINHDCHHVMVVGASPEAMAAATQRLSEIDGGIVVFNGAEFEELPLEVGGLMTQRLSPLEVAARLRSLKRQARALGCELEEPFLQLSFLALPVIPRLKITDRGLVDTEKGQLVPLARGS